VRGNQTMAELVQNEYERVGAPDWTPEEDALARDLQAKAKVQVEGLRRGVHRMKGPAVQRPARQRRRRTCRGRWSDGEDVLPGQHPEHQLPPLGGPASRSPPRSPTRAPSQHSKVVAGSVIECFRDPAIVEQAKAHIQERGRGDEVFQHAAGRPEAAARAQPRMMEKFARRCASTT